jgi:hypothetical protein
MKLLHPDLVQEYFEYIKDTYPHLSLDEVNKVCSAPFLEVRKGIESGEFPTTRLKFFGTFVVYPKKVEYYLKVYEKMFKEHRITLVNYFKKKEQFEKFLKRKENEGKSKFE